MNTNTLTREARLPWQVMTRLPGFGLMEALTLREMAVLVSLAADGQSNTAIGDELCISEKTVRSHLVHIMLKLGATTRTQVVLQAQRLGLLDMPDKLSSTARAMLEFIRANPAAFRELVDFGALPQGQGQLKLDTKRQTPKEAGAAGGDAMKLFPRWPWRRLLAVTLLPLLAVAAPILVGSYPLPPLINPFYRPPVLAAEVVAAPTPPSEPTACDAWKEAGGQIIYRCVDEDVNPYAVCYVNAMMIFCLPQE